MDTYNNTDAYKKAERKAVCRDALTFLRIVVAFVPALLLLVASWALSVFGTIAATLASWACHLLGIEPAVVKSLVRFVVLAPLALPLLLLATLLGFIWAPFHLIGWFALWLLGIANAPELIWA